MILDAMFISLKVALIAVIIILIISMLIVKRSINRKSKIMKIVESIIILPLFIPPSALGYIILLLCGRNGPIGKILNEGFNISIIFTITAAVIAAVITALPIMYQSIKTAVISVDKSVREAAMVDGASDFKVFARIVIPLSKKGILTGMLLSFGRAFGEFGATILVAGNIPGKTQTLPMAMYYSIENNNNGEALSILILVFIIAIFLLSIYSYLINKVD